MQEGSVTLGEKTYKLEDLFFVMATMNPVEQEGTFSLPEATLDRFAMLLDMRYVSRDDEMQMLKNCRCSRHSAQKLVEAWSPSRRSSRCVVRSTRSCQRVPTVLGYIVDLARGTRPEDDSSTGADKPPRRACVKA